MTSYIDKIPMSLPVDEQFDPQTGRRYTPEQMSDVLTKKQRESEAFRLSITGAGMFGGSFAIFCLGWVILCICEPRCINNDIVQVHVEPPATVGAGAVAPVLPTVPAVVQPPTQGEPKPSLESTILQQTHSPSTTSGTPLTSAASPHVTFRINEPPPPLGQRI